MDWILTGDRRDPAGSTVPLERPPANGPYQGTATVRQIPIGVSGRELAEGIVEVVDRKVCAQPGCHFAPQQSSPFCGHHGLSRRLARAADRARAQRHVLCIHLGCLNPALAGAKICATHRARRRAAQPGTQYCSRCGRPGHNERTCKGR